MLWVHIYVSLDSAHWCKHDGHVHYLDCGDINGAYRCQRLSNCILHICAIYCMLIKTVKNIVNKAIYKRQNQKKNCNVCDRLWTNFLFIYKGLRNYILQRWHADGQ